MACMFPRDQNVNRCGVDTKIVTHSGRRSQLLLSAMRCGHPSSYIGSSVDRALILITHDLFASYLLTSNTYYSYQSPISNSFANLNTSDIFPPAFWNNPTYTLSYHRLRLFFVTTLTSHMGKHVHTSEWRRDNRVTWWEPRTIGVNLKFWFEWLTWQTYINYSNRECRQLTNSITIRRSPLVDERCHSVNILL